MKCWWPLVVLVACGGDDDDPTTSSESTPSESTPTDDPPTTTPTPSPTVMPAPVTTTPPWEAPAGGVITLTTRDGLSLEADYRPASTEGAAAVCLLHMIPPSNDRSNWPDSFLDALADEGWAVIALDRRGAGGSEGEPEDAYLGPDGKYDVEACALRLSADGYGPLMIIGASNGTTSMLDYAVWAGTEGLPEPVALGYMTGGSYTEAQNDVADAPPVPAVFTYSTDERLWSVAQQSSDPGSWVFHEYPQGDHGTRMFTAAPDVSDDLVSFFRGALAR